MALSRKCPLKIFLDIKRLNIFVILFLITSKSLFGQEIFYYPSGKKSSEKITLDLNYFSVINYFENGSIKSKGYLKNTKIDSIWTYFNENGIIKSILNFKEGKKNGIQLLYTDSGQIERKEFFILNEKSGKQYYYNDGRLNKIESYLQGKKSGREVLFNLDSIITQLLEYDNGILINQQKINRIDIANQKQGTWIELDTNLVIRIQGNYLNNKKNGYFKYYDTKEKLIRIDLYENDVLIKEKKQFVQKLETQNTNGETEIGLLVDGKKFGLFRQATNSGPNEAVKQYEDNKIVEEGFLDSEGKKTGIWKEYHDNTELKSIGKYTKGKRDSLWTFYYENKALQQKGNFRNGLPFGKWTYYFDSGNLRKNENYINGKLDGDFEEFSIDSQTVSKGEYYNDDKEGKWLIKQGEITLIGEYRSGKRVGEWLYYYPNGAVAYKGTFDNGVAQGKHVYFFDNGAKWFEGSYVEGKKSGNWYYYPLDKELYEKIIITYENGIEKKYDNTIILPTIDEYYEDQIREEFSID